MILYSKLPVLWELMSDQHQAPRTEIQEDSCSYKKKKLHFLLSLCVSVCCGKNGLLSDPKWSEKICSQASCPFLDEFSNRVF